MADQVNKYFRKEGDFIYINAEYAEAYVPKDLFKQLEDGKEKMSESAIAYEYGNGFITMGMFLMKFFTSDSQPREEVPFETFCYPNSIETYPTSSTTATIELEDSDTPIECRVFQYYSGDIMMHSLHRRALSNVEKYIALLMSGRIPSTLSYWEILEMWEKNLAVNKVDPGVPSVVLQGYISKMCRDKKNYSNEFRKVIGKNPNLSPYAYKALNMNGVSAYSSTMSALSFERLNEKITTSLIMEKENIPQQISPIEKVLVM